MSLEWAWQRSSDVFNFWEISDNNSTRGSAMAEGLRDALVSGNSATTKYPYRVALFA